MMMMLWKRRLHSRNYVKRLEYVCVLFLMMWGLNVLKSKIFKDSIPKCPECPSVLCEPTHNAVPIKRLHALCVGEVVEEEPGHFEFKRCPPLQCLLQHKQNEFGGIIGKLKQEEYEKGLKFINPIFLLEYFPECENSLSELAEICVALCKDYSRESGKSAKLCELSLLSSGGRCFLEMRDVDKMGPKSRLFKHLT